MFTVTAVSSTWLPGLIITSYSLVSQLGGERSFWSLKMSFIGLLYFILSGSLVSLTLVQALKMKGLNDRLVRHLLAALCGLFLTFTFFRIAAGG